MSRQGGDGAPLSWHLIDQALSAALEIPASRRQAWLQEYCAGQPELLQEVLSLLDDDAPSAGLFAAAERERERIHAAALQDAGAIPGAGGLAGSRLGPYRLDSLLGAGGMGAVYKAVRDDGQFQQTVAIKVLPAWAGDARTVARLYTERQILSSLQHPNITRLLDGGETADGFPYLVTEYIDGLDISTYVEQHKPPLNALLLLFIQVCEAVQYAHQHLVIHRDIKPGNILVSADGQPHLLDFGIAKLLEGAELGIEQPRTRTGFTPMTPEYASPEQRSGDVITTASDIFQLGLLLYRLLTGSHPEHDPAGSVTRPSAALTGPGTDGGEPARTRLARQLKGDLDTIVLKALRKDPAQRYASATGLAADVRRFLNGEAIQARPESLWSASRRLARHYPLATGLALSLVGVLLVSGISLALYARELAEQRDVAAKQAQRAGQVKNVLVDIFRRSDPLQADTIGGKAASVWDSLDAAAEEAREELADQPDILAELLSTLAGLQSHAGQRREAMALLQEANELFRQLGPEFFVQLTVNEAEYALLLSVDNFSAAWELLQAALAKVPRLVEAAPLAAVSVLLDAAHVARTVGNAAQAVEHYRQAFAVLQRSGQDAWLQRIEVLSGEAGALMLMDDLEAAEPLLREALMLGEAHFGPGHSRLTGTLSVLGQLERRRGNGPASVAYNERMVAIMERNSATTYEAMLSAKNNLGLSYSTAGRHHDAQNMLREIVSIRREMSGPAGSSSLAVAMKNLASSLHMSGDYEEAMMWLDQSQAMMREHLPGNSPYHATPLFTRALVYLDTGQPALAIPQAEATLDILLPILGEAHFQVQVTRCVLAEAHQALGNEEAAWQLAGPALEGILAAGNATPRYEQRCRETVLKLADSVAGPRLSD